MGHLWDIYGTSMGYPCLWLAFTIAENGIVIFGICVFHQFPHLLFLALKQGYFACIILQNRRNARLVTLLVR